jgi:hypothetical protein
MDSRRIERNQPESPPQSTGNQNFWRRYCGWCIPSKESVVDDVPLDRTGSSRRRTEKSREVSSPADIHIQGWQGSSDQTLNALLQKITQKVDLSRYLEDRERGIERLENVIYNMYADNYKQVGFYEEISDEEYKRRLDTIECPENMRIDEIGDGYLHFCKKRFRDHSNLWRFSLNVQPDNIIPATKLILQKIAGLDYVAEVKVVSKSVEAVERRLDNLLIFFHEPPGGDTNRNELAELSRQYAKYTRDGHPAMMMPFEDINSMAFGEQTTDGTNWGKPRTRAIAEAIMNLGSLEVDPQILLQEVKKRFEVYGIDPKRPYQNKKIRD